MQLKQARLAAGEGSVAIAGVTADSREALPGSLFVALRGTRSDGHDFLGQAVARGAVAVLREPGRGIVPPGVAVLEAASPLAALGELAGEVRRLSEAATVGIAGTAGKTTTKDILHALCASQLPTVASPASFNNELGVPLTVCRLEQATKVLICELGTGGLGEVAGLCRIARPTVGVITNVGAEHLEVLGSVENAARANAELLDALPRGSPVVLPDGERLLDPHRRNDLTELSFGLARSADVRPLRWAAGVGGTDVELAVGGERLAFRTSLRAAHHRLSLCAAVGAYLALGLPLESVGEGAARVPLSPWRGQEVVRRDGGVVINDAYNANPISLGAALESLVDRANGARAVAVLGEMAELGPQSRTWHRRLGRLAVQVGIDVVIGVGPLASLYCEAAAGGAETHCVETVEDAAALLPKVLRAGDVVLLKGSRAAGIERLEAAACG